MGSVYASQVEAYGRRWHRPWLVFLSSLALLWTLLWITHESSEAQVLCEQVAGSRYRAAVEIDGLMWTADMKAALACAQKHRRRVFLAFHAITDTRALVNEITVFQDRRARSALRRYVLVKLETDFVWKSFYQRRPSPEDQLQDGEANLKFEQQRFNTVQEPMYVILQPKEDGDFRVVATYDEARIFDSAKFVRFLEDPAPSFWRNAINTLQQFAKRP